MPYLIRIGAGSVIAMVLFIPLLIFMALFLPVLIVVILLIAAAAAVTATLVSKAKRIAKKQERRATKAKGIIDVEYKVK